MHRSGEGLFQMLKFASAFVYRAATHFATQKTVKLHAGEYRSSAVTKPITSFDQAFMTMGFEVTMMI